MSIPRAVLLLLSAFVIGVLLASPTTAHQSRALVAPPSYDGASMSKASTLEDEALQSPIIVVANVANSTVQPGNTTIKTQVNFTLEKSLKGSLGSGNTTGAFSVSLPGGVSGNRGLLVGGIPNFVAGERVLLFMQSSQAGYELHSIWQSKYSLAGTDAIQLESHTDIPISQVESRLSKVLGQAVTIGAKGNAQPFVLWTQATGCAPWADAQFPVQYFVNPANPPTVAPTGFSFLSTAYTAWHDWQALPNSHPSFELMGSTANPGTDHNDGQNTISWQDLNTPGGGTFVGAGVIGVDYCEYNPANNSRIEADTQISTGTDSNGAQWTFSIAAGDPGGSFISLWGDMEHELGHGLGMNHSDMACDGSDATPLMCPAMSEGGHKHIQPDDSNGAASMYPITGAAPGAPSGLTATAAGTTVNLGWNGGAGSILSYDIERSTDCATFVSVNTVPAVQHSYADNDYGFGLPVGGYCYRVKSLGAGGDSVYSNVATTGGVSTTCLGGTPYVNTNGVWATIPGAVHDIASGGVTWAIGTNAVPGGCGIYQYIGGANTWQPIAGGATNVAVDAQGQPWVLQSQAGGTIYRLVNGNFVNVPGSALQISASVGGSVWVIGTNLVGPGGHGIYQYVGAPNYWQPINGSADQIAVAPDNSIWVIQTNGSIYHYSGGIWTPIPGQARQISVGVDGSVYVIGINAVPGGFGIYKYVGGANTWQALSGGAVEVAGAQTNQFWVRQ